MRKDRRICILGQDAFHSTVQSCHVLSDPVAGGKSKAPSGEAGQQRPKHPRGFGLPLQAGLQGLGGTTRAGRASWELFGICSIPSDPRESKRKPIAP